MTRPKAKTKGLAIHDAATPSEGFFEVGINDLYEVVVNHPDLIPDADGAGHIVFSVEQARHFACLLLQKADEAVAAAARKALDAARKADA